ncbi:uncharacterized protein TNCV_4670131 [Trichonephila clavipes]|nr:uncharacterized protein TNCV_4670131 [Trichonephila clavipes]
MLKDGKGLTKIMKRIEWDQGKQSKACNEPSIKQIIFFFNALINQGEYSLVTQSFLDSDMFKSSTSFYRHLGRWSNNLVSCPECQEPIKHWLYGQKKRPENVNHVTACLQRFVEEAKIQEEAEEKETEEEETVVCGYRHFQPVPRGMRGRRKDRVSEFVGFYDSLLENPEMWEEGVTFQNGLGNDVWGMVQRYLRQDLMWFHIMVKHDVFDTFRKEKEKIRDQCVILPFWCLCDGLMNEKGKIQHLHIILACEPESSFEDVWKGKIRYEFPNSGRAKKCIKIKNAFYLVRTIMYVSQPKSSCDKDEMSDHWMESVNVLHFHINRPLHPHNIAILCTLFPGGIEKLLWEQLGNKNVSSWEKVAKRVPDSWHLHKHSNDSVCCPECLEPMTLGHFYYKHAPKTHTLDSRKQCIFCFGRRQWNHAEKNLSVNVNHIVSYLKLFVTNEKYFSAIVDAKEEDVAEEIEVETCECQHFQSNPRDMAGRRKLNSVGFYDSMFEKPEMWEKGIEFQCGLGKDVWGIVERYLKGDLEWFHISVKHDIF